MGTFDFKKPKGIGRNRSKYGNIRCSHAGEKFDSKGEMQRWVFLLDAERNGRISDLERQINFELCIESEFGVFHICDMRPDFRYTHKGVVVVEDYKGDYKLPADWQIKKKLIKAIHGIEINIVTSATDPLGYQP